MALRWNAGGTALLSLTFPLIFLSHFLELYGYFARFKFLMIASDRIWHPIWACRGLWDSCLGFDSSANLCHCLAWTILELCGLICLKTCQSFQWHIHFKLRCLYLWFYCSFLLRWWHTLSARTVSIATLFWKGLGESKFWVYGLNALDLQGLVTCPRTSYRSFVS